MGGIKKKRFLFLNKSTAQSVLQDSDSSRRFCRNPPLEAVRHDRTRSIIICDGAVDGLRSDDDSGGQITLVVLRRRLIVRRIK